MKISRILSLVLTFLITITAMAQQTTQLQGRVYLNDNVPAAYATLYLPQYGIGTVTDDKGNYWMDNIPVSSSVTLEYAFLGYKTTQVKLALTQPNHKYAHDQHLEEDAIMLEEVYLTPNGEDPAVYILRKLHEQGTINRKRLESYKAVVNGEFHAQNIDLLETTLPSLIMTPLHTTMRVAGMYTLWKYWVSAEKIEDVYQYIQTWDKGKVKNSDMNIVYSKPEMSKDVASKMKDMQQDNLFEMFYGDGKKFDAKKVQKMGWKLKGVIEENGKTIDILTRTTGDSIRTVKTIYIIEDLWSVLRFESKKSAKNFSRIECRDIGGGIYMPVSYVTNPMPLDLEKIINDFKNDPDLKKKNGEDVKMLKNMYERFDKAVANRQDHNLHIISPYNIVYSNVVVK